MLKTREGEAGTSQSAGKKPKGIDKKMGKGTTQEEGEMARS